MNMSSLPSQEYWFSRAQGVIELEYTIISHLFYTILNTQHSWNNTTHTIKNYDC